MILEFDLQFFAADGPGGEKTEEPTAKKKSQLELIDMFPLMPLTDNDAVLLYTKSLLSHIAKQHL